jgi:hypothetical protein
MRYSDHVSVALGARGFTVDAFGLDAELLRKFMASRRARLETVRLS